MLLVLSLLTAAQADCMSGSLSVWPASGATLPSRLEVALEAYGTERARLEGWTEGDLALVRGDERITLQRLAIHVGSFTDDQVILAPARAPSPGVWTLHVEGEPLTFWTGVAHEPVRWIVADHTPSAPRWTGAPSVVETSRQHFGCGPGVDVVVAVPAADATWIQATVAREGGRTTTMRVPVVDGRITLGHGMCSGQFELDEGERYVATFVAIGADGTRASSPAGPLPFVAP